MKAHSTTISLTASRTEDGRLSKTAGYSVLFITLGLARAIVGPTLPFLAEHAHVSLSAISILFTTIALGGLFGSLAGGWLYDRIAGHPILIAMLVMIAGIFFTVPFIPSLWLLAGLFLILGIVESIVDLGGNTLLVWVHREKVGPFMNALHFFFGVGASLSPMLVGWMIGRGGDVMHAYWALALLVVPVAIGFVFLPSPVHQNVSTMQEKGSLNLLLVGGVAMFLFLYAGTEVAFGGWLYTYAITQDLTTSTQAAYLTSTFGGAITLGRLLSIPLVARIKPVTLMFGSLAGCVVCLMLLRSFPHNVPMLWGAICGLGLSMAAVFPTTLAFSGRRMHLTGQVTSIFFLGTGLGTMSIPWGVGQIMEFRDPQDMMTLLLSCILASVAVLIGICQVARTREA